MAPPCRLPSPLRCLQALSCCLAFSTAAAAGPWQPGEGDGCVAAWAICFSLTLLLLLADSFPAASSSFCSLSSRRDLPLVHAAAASLACAAAAVLWSLGHLRGDHHHDDPRGRPRALRASATAASCLASLFYAAEVLRDRARAGQTAPYLSTPSGLLKVAETFLSLLLLCLAAELGAGAGPEAWRWCLGIFCLSFVLGMLLVGSCLLGCGGGGAGWGGCWAGGCWSEPQDPRGLKRCLGVYALLGVVAYAAASVLWPLYAFREELGGRARRPPGCGAACPWERSLLVALLSALQLLAFGVDLLQTGRLVLLRA